MSSMEKGKLRSMDRFDAKRREMSDKFEKLRSRFDRERSASTIPSQFSESRVPRELIDKGNTSIKTETINGVEVAKHSNHYFLVKGENARFLKTKLRELGGRYTAFQKIPEFIFRDDKYNDVLTFLNSEEAGESIKKREEPSAEEEKRVQNRMSKQPVQTVIYRINKPKVGHEVTIDETGTKYKVVETKGAKAIIDTIFLKRVSETVEEAKEKGKETSNETVTEVVETKEDKVDEAEKEQLVKVVIVNGEWKVLAKADQEHQVVFL